MSVRYRMTLCYYIHHASFQLGIAVARIIVPRVEVVWITTQGEIGHHKPPTCTSLTHHRLTLSDLPE